MNSLLPWLDAHNGTVSAAATIILVIITAWYAWQTRETVRELRRQRTAEEENRFLAQRPIVYPVNKLSADSSTIGLDWTANRCHITLANAGPGLATDLCAVLMAPPDKSGALPRRYALWKERPLPPGEAARQVAMEVGQTMMGTDARIGAYELIPPPAPVPIDMLMGRAPIVTARLTLTYRDVVGRKHAGIFDDTSLAAVGERGLFGRYSRRPGRSRSRRTAAAGHRSAGRDGVAAIAGGVTVRDVRGRAMTTLALDERAIEVSGDVLMAALAEIATESHDYACGEGIEHPARLSHRLG